MRYFILFVCYTNLVFATGKNEIIMPTHYFDLIHTDLNLIPIWDKHQMKGEALLTITPYFYPQSKLVLDAKEFQIEEVALKKGNQKIGLQYNYNRKKLFIFLDKSYRRSDSLKVYIRYVANPDSMKATDGKAIADERGLYFINTDGKRKNVPMQLWTQGEPDANSAWFPTLDYPSEKHTQKITVTYDKKLVSLSNGKLTTSKLNKDGTKTDVWTQNLPHSTYLTTLVIGDFKIVKDQWRGKEVSYYMEPKYEHLARPIFGRAPEMMEYFSNLLGVDYPWDKFSNVIVHDFVAGAMENTSAVTNSTILCKDKRELIDGNDDETIVHELVHHWFGDLVTCETWSHTSLNESFANFAEYLWYDYKYGNNAAQAHWQRDLSPYFAMSSSKREPLIRFNYEKADDMFDIISYNKGGKILQMLRVRIGDEAFFASLKLYLNRYRFKTAEYSNLRACFEEVTGEDLNWFFDQWYLQGGHPIITSSHKKSGDSVRITISQKHNFDTAMIYNLAFDVDIYSLNGVERKRILLNSKKDSFLFIVKDFKSLILDGANAIVAIKNESKSTEEWMYLLSHSQNYIDQSTALKKLNSKKSKDEVKKLLFETLSSDKPRIISAVIKLIDDEWLTQDQKWNNKLIEIAKTNPRGDTRSAALEKLSSNPRIDTLRELIAEKLKDSSYLVEAEALNMLSKIDSTAALKYAIKSTNYTNYALLAKAFELIGKTKDPKMLKFFEEAIDRTQGFKKLAIYSRFGTFLASQSEEVFLSKLDEFKALANSKVSTDKYAGTYALNSLKTELNKSEDEVSKARLKSVEEILKDKNQDELDVH
jgi:aminopeptidase N